MKDLKTNSNKIFILFSNVEKNFLCDYVSQTAKILSQNYFTIVAYYQKPHSWRFLLQHRFKLREILDSWKKIVFSDGHGVYDCEFISLIPFQHFRMIYNINRYLTLFELSCLILLHSLVKLRFFDLILWIFHPTAEFFVKRLGEKKSLYDIVDYIEELKDNDEDLFRLEKKLMSEADLVFANSSTLAKSKAKIRKDIRIVPVGCAIEDFPDDYLPKTLPMALKDIKKPIAGFIGHLDYRLDIELIRYLIWHNPHISFVFIGKILDKQPKNEASEPISSQIAKLKKYPNFHHLQEIEKKFLKDYLYYFDVALIPYKTDCNMVSYSNPMKFYEYLAMGIPVVSIPIPALGKYHLPVVKFPQSKEEFNGSLDKLLVNPRLKDRFKIACRRISEKNIWRAKIGKILIELEK